MYLTRFLKKKQQALFGSCFLARDYRVGLLYHIPGISSNAEERMTRLYFQHAETAVFPRQYYYQQQSCNASSTAVLLHEIVVSRQHTATSMNLYVPGTY